VIDKIDLQLKKYKNKLNIKGTESIRHELAATGEDGSVSEIFDESEEETQNIVKVKRFALKPMSAKEASLQMELIGHQFFVFLDDETEEVHVLYKRKDGDYGLIVPEF
ncbi:MAG: ribosome-associated translation inhibitor RaiA, partial [Eubacteriaceae bacterium]|nr:ribosome-associated translation inhibitor RaiA [Eubacteriaceae bacterium]